MQRKIFLIVLCLFLFFFTFAQETKRIWEDVEGMENCKSKLFIYKSQNSNGTAVIICPGGSYCYLGMNIEGHNVARWLNSMGINAFVLKYRVGMNGFHYPSMIQDIQRSIQWVRENRQKWELDSNKIGVMGFSAGGHLVGTAGEYGTENYLQKIGVKSKTSVCPDFVAMIYPVVSMDDSIVHQKSRRNLLGRQFNKDIADKMSLEKHVHTDMPPFFLVHAEDDKTVNVCNSKLLIDNMKKKSCQLTYHIYKTGGHGFGVKPLKNSESALWMADFESWYYKLIKKETDARLAGPSN